MYTIPGQWNWNYIIIALYLIITHLNLPCIIINIQHQMPSNQMSGFEKEQSKYQSCFCFTFSRKIIHLNITGLRKNPLGHVCKLHGNNLLERIWSEKVYLHFCLKTDQEVVVDISQIIPRNQLYNFPYCLQCIGHTERDLRNCFGPTLFSSIICYSTFMPRHI